VDFNELSVCWKGKYVLFSTYDFTHLTFRQNRVAVVSSLTSVGWSQLNFFWMTLFNQCLYCLLLVIWFLFVQCLSFDSECYSLQCYCLIWFSYSVFKLFSVCSVLILEMFSRYFDPIKHQPSSSQSTSYSRQGHLLSYYRSKRPITVIHIEGNTKPISPTGWADGGAWTVLCNDKPAEHSIMNEKLFPYYQCVPRNSVNKK
jgi:magnesium-transporting ATPase (P-type)